MKIATYGFAADQGRKLSRILQLSKTADYQLVEFNPSALPDLLLVFGEDQLSSTAITELPQYFHSRMILVGKRRPQTQAYPFIGYPLVSSRVLNALDQILSTNEEFSADGVVEASVDSVEEKTEELPEDLTTPLGSDETLIDESLTNSAVNNETETVTEAITEALIEPSEDSPFAFEETMESPVTSDLDEVSIPVLESEEIEGISESDAAEILDLDNTDDFAAAEETVGEVAALSEEVVIDEAPATEETELTAVVDTGAADLSVSEVVSEGISANAVEEATEVLSETDAAVNAEVEQSDTETGAADYRVLVVDDSHPMQQALAKELQAAFDSLDIDFADEGLIALELAEQNSYDFIFLDIMMPGIDGFETCTRMRAMEKLKKLPIIMLSSKTSPLDEVKGIMAGSSTYLTKPIDPEEFQKVIARIRKWLENFS